ncbi:GNAT family N-acetyltransferase [Salinibacterium sp. ZJ450]|uniref:GNAT family N-acetyltransferase n=1 Tax=Salinibacterium sp. ZJ450 TaxID=2708338 RepID=UPI001421EE89|nr:GNAT family N-acetyltransferase [Salinibacterium sp. ZJ450]
MPSELQALPARLLDQGRQVIPAGTLMYWELNVEDAPTASVPGGIETREVQSLAQGSADLASAMLLITDSFAGYTNHYSANPRLDPGVVAQGYLQWAESTLTGQSSRGFLISDPSGVVGCATVVSVDAGETAWEIELAGMSTQRQGKGLYRYLLEAVRSAALRDGIDKILISTQSHNIRVQRAWARAGFVPVAAVDTLHLMR